MKMFRWMILLFPAYLVAGCGGSSDSDGSAGTTEQSQVSVGITDAAVDGAREVWVEFESVELKPQNGKSIVFEYDPARQINLLALQGNTRDMLLDNETVPAGDYDWIRLHVDSGECEVMEPGDDPDGSYIVLSDGGIEPLFIPSGEESGLKLVSGFTVDADGTSDFTIDFDLRKSVIKPAGQPCHYLKPALRLVDGADAGSISGTVAPELINDASCFDGEEGEDEEYGNAVYVLAGLDVHADDVDGDDLDEDSEEDEADDDVSPDEDSGDDSNGDGDSDANDSDDEAADDASDDEDDDRRHRGKVVSTALVEYNDATGNYEYTAGYVPAGDYTIAFTCEAELDDPEEEDDLDFLQSANVSVVAGQETIHDFTLIP